MNETGCRRFQQGQSHYIPPTRPGLKKLVSKKNSRNDENGFTLIELLIVVTILPLIVGALAAGMIAVFSLQSGVQNRLGDTGDSQVVEANFQSDVVGAASLTTAPNNSSAQCGPGTQILGLAWGPVTGQSYPYQYVVSYVEVPSGSTHNLVRQYCSSGYSTTATSSTVISYDVPAGLTIPSTGVGIVAGAPTGTTPSTAWISTQYVTGVQFPITEPNSSYSYTLDAVPAASSGVAAKGEPLNPAATAGCGFATPGTGYYASTLCLIDFSGLTGNNYLAATSGCLETSAPLPGGYTLYFCIGITGSPIAPSPLPTWQNAFLGNTCAGATSGCTNGSPFYTGIPGSPALYQTASGTTTITISNISVTTPLGVSATGWEVVGVDAESTDVGESISFNAGWPNTWTGSTALNILPNDESYDTPTDPVGNACDDGTELTTSGNGQTVTCAETTANGLKTGTTMVEATMPSTFTTTLVGTGLQAMAFGLMLS
jgi:prepilin-type N-terminal cleavage/methylation domain-containing protein